MEITTNKLNHFLNNSIDKIDFSKYSFRICHIATCQHIILYLLQKKTYYTFSLEDVS